MCRSSSRTTIRIWFLWPEQLKGALGKIAEADTLDDLPLEVRVSFGIVTKTDQGRIEVQNDSNSAVIEPNQDAEFSFNQLKQAITPLDGQESETHISTIVDEFTSFIKPILPTGIVRPEDLTRYEIGFDSVLAIVDNKTDLPDENPLEDKQRYRERNPTDVILADLLNDAGLLGQRIGDFPTLETIRIPLNEWLRNEMRPTLVYDQFTTQKAKSFVRSQVEPVYDLINEGDEFLPPDGVLEEELLRTLEAEYAASIEGIPLAGENGTGRGLSHFGDRASFVHLLVHRDQRSAGDQRLGAFFWVFTHHRRGRPHWAGSSLSIPCEVRSQSSWRQR